MILTFTDLIYAEEKDNGRELHFDSAGNKYNFSFGYFSKNDLPISSDIGINNGNLIMSGGSTEKSFSKCHLIYNINNYLINKCNIIICRWINISYFLIFHILVIICIISYKLITICITFTYSD